MTQRVCMVTGATSGIGLATARQLAAQRDTVVLVGRSAAKCTAAVALVRRATPDAHVDWLAGDLAVQAQVKELAAEFRRRYSRLDVLVNNAGTLFPRRDVTPEGVEMTLAVNHLAGFLLTNLLLDILAASAPARVVNVASVAHERGRLDFADLQMRRGYRPFRAYARSKLANLLFTYELARRLAGTGVTANAVDPGLVHTGLGRKGGRLPNLVWRLTHLRYRASSLMPEQGADTIVLLASSRSVACVNGAYFRERKPRPSSAASRDVAAAERLWSLSEQWTGLA